MLRIVFACAMSVFVIFRFSYCGACIIPEYLENIFLSKSKFAKSFNKFLGSDRENSYFHNYHINIFIEIGLYVSFGLFLVSLIIFVIDLCLRNKIELLLGESMIWEICGIILFSFIAYTLSIGIFLYFFRKIYEKKMNKK